MASHPSQSPRILEPKAVTALRTSPIGSPNPQNVPIVAMERSISQDIREERDDLKTAAEQSINAIMDLALDGTIRWISQTWQQLTGTETQHLCGKNISDIILDHKTIFTDAVIAMRRDDTKSRIIRFTIATSPDRPDTTAEDTPTAESAIESTPGTDGDEGTGQISLEAQGIMVYDRSTGEESHTMWMIKPAIDRAVTIDLPGILVESLGIGAHVLAQYLTELAAPDVKDATDRPPPQSILCRICERSISPWWFEKHTELCLQEHQAEMEIQVAQENLTEHRTAIVKVLDALEAQSVHNNRSSPPNEGSPTSPKLIAEYKGFPIGPTQQQPSQPSSASPSGRASPTTQPRSRESSTSSGHLRARSFAVRRPLARIVELVLDLCDTALEISVPSVKDNIDGSDEIRTQSPQSESRIAQVLHWQSPSASTLDSEQGLALLCDDTADLSHTKIEACFRHQRVLEYSERIRMEFDVLVHECIEAALGKAARIAKGELSDASDSDGIESDSDHPESPLADASPKKPHCRPDNIQAVRNQSLPAAPTSAPLPITFRNPSDPLAAAVAGRRASSTANSTRSNSPGGTRTPRSLLSAFSTTAGTQRPSNMAVESDAGAESDSSVRSSSVNSSRLRSESPGHDVGLTRMASNRGRKRTSLALPSLQGIRQDSPSQSSAGPLSPMRGLKPRFSSLDDPGQSPILSPTMFGNDLSPLVSKPPSISHHHHHHRRTSSVAPLEVLRCPSSPRPAAISSNPQPKAPQTSIKDFEIIKPISKGAFGSVYLAKKKVTGDYYALKVLKKDDMVAKNQITNVKAERAIMMWQGESDFVAKLYWTFASKDYLYLVMEYLNGGDCASLIKNLGGLPEDWAKKYVAECVLGVQHLHNRQIVHRDLKPDNLLIDQRGHLKLTDFGLSRMGLVGRQKQMQSREQTESPDLFKHAPFRKLLSISSSRSTSFDFAGTQPSPGATPALMPATGPEVMAPSYFNLNRSQSRDSTTRRTSGQRSDSGGDGDALQAMFKRFTLSEDATGYTGRTPIEEEAASDEGDSPDPYMLQPVSSNSEQQKAQPVSTPPLNVTAMLPPPMALFDPDDKSRRFVGTPDYLAPETIHGVGQDEMSDWWSLGCILFEFLYGYPPFHADTPELVFQNILAHDIHWPDDEDCPVSAEAKDLINKLLVSDPKLRLSSNASDTYENGGDEVRAHAWFADIDWDRLREDEASFIPNPSGVEDTEYFDARGASLQDFTAQFEDQVPSPGVTPGGSEYVDRPHDALSRVRVKVNSIKRNLMPLHIPAHVRDGRTRRLSEPVAADDFGNFQFKNLPVLEKANKDVLSKLRAEAMQAQTRSSQTLHSSPVSSPSPALDASPIIPVNAKRALSISKGPLNRPKSPSMLSQSNPSPNRASQPSSPLLVSFSAGQHHERRKTSSGSSSFSHSTSNSLQPGSFFDAPRLAAGLSQPPAAQSPIKLAKTVSAPAPPMRAEGSLSRQPSISSPRQRSHTISSQEDVAADMPLNLAKRRSHPTDNVSPSSSDTEEQRQRVLMRVHKRRQDSRRLSHISLAEGPAFRPLDVLICEDHPVSRLVMERLLEKLRCRTISVQNGSEVVRYALSKVKFDIIMMEFKLPQINGADIARMIRETRNANSHTPIVAVTGYLKELQAPHDFDALVEKPATNTKLSEVLGRLCQWKPPPVGWSPAQMQMPYCPPSNLRKESLAISESPPSTTTSSIGVFSARHASSRDDSITSGSIGDDSQFEVISSAFKQRQERTDSVESEMERRFGGLGISRESPGSQSGSDKQLTPRPGHTRDYLSGPWSSDGPQSGSRGPSKKSSLEVLAEERRHQEVTNAESAEAGDDEDDELGSSQIRERSPNKHGSSSTARPSKLGIEMLRTNSDGSVISSEERFTGLAEANTSATSSVTSAPSEITGPVPQQQQHQDPVVAAAQAQAIATGPASQVQIIAGSLEPPEIFPMEPATETREIVMSPEDMRFEEQQKQGITTTMTMVELDKTRQVSDVNATVARSPQIEGGGDRSGVAGGMIPTDGVSPKS